MNTTRVRKLMDSLHDELESASRVHDMDDIVDLYSQFYAEMDALIESIEQDEDAD